MFICGENLGKSVPMYLFKTHFCACCKLKQTDGSYVQF